MKKTKTEKGITLIALIITIVVLLILASVAISSIQNDGILTKANKAAFISKVKKYEEELTLYINSKELEHMLQYDETSLLANKTTEPSITDIIKSMSEEDAEKFVIQDGKLKYTGSNAQEEEWSQNLGLELGYTLKRIYGNSVQNGTPSPTSPVKIESVGDKTKNLVDVQKGFIYHNNPSVPMYNWERTETGFKVTFLTAWENGAWTRHGFRLGTTEELAGKTITVSYGEHIGSSQKPILQIFATDIEGDNAVNFDNVSDFYDGYIGGTSFTTKLSGNDNDVQSKKLTYTIPDDLEQKYIGVGFYLNVNAPTNIGDTTEYKNIQVEIGDTVTEYEPYGYKIPVKASGKNLLNLPISTSTNKNLTCIVSDNNVVTFEGIGTGYTIFNYDILNIPANTTVTLSFNKNSSKLVTFRLRNSVTNEYVDIVESGTFKTPTFDVDRFQIAGNPNIDYSDTIINNIQLELGTTGTDYEPYVEPITTNIYLDEPLRKIGNYEDYIDFESKQVVRNVRNIKLNIADMNGSEAYPGWRSVPFIMEDYPNLNNPNLSKYTLVMCNLTTNKGVGLQTTNTGVIFLDKNIWGLTQTEWLTNYPDLQFDLCYGLATPDPQTIELPNIPTLKDDTVLSVETIIQPSKIEI